MSDGDNATPGRWAPEGHNDGDHQLMTMTPPGPAPWERWQNSSEETPVPHRRNASRRRNGSVSVADLIARVNAEPPPSGGRSQRRAASASPKPEVAEFVEPVEPVEPVSLSEVSEPEAEYTALEIADLAAPMPDIAEVAYPSEVPDLDRIHGTSLEPAGAPDWDELAPATEAPGLYGGPEMQRGLYGGPSFTSAASSLAEPPGLYGGPSFTSPASSLAEPPGLSGEPEMLPARIDPPRQTPPADTEPAAHGPHHRAKLAGRAVAAMMAILALVLTGSAWQWSSSKNRSLNHVSALDPDSHDILDAAGQYGDENFLIVGADTRAGANSDIGAGSTEDAEGARSDTIMLVNIPANRKRVVVVSFPRDLAITPIQCEAWNSVTGAYGPIYDEETGTYSDDIVYTETKLNSTYAFGGPKCLVKEIQKLSGLAINRFMAVDFVGFGKMVDALGGVEVCTPSPLYDLVLGSVLEDTGRQRVNGGTALNYVRARHVTTEDNGDYGRIKRQQLFLSSLLRSLISTNTFFSPTKLNNVVNMFIGDSSVDNVTTKDLVNLGQSLQKVAAGHITFVTVPTSETDENGDEVPRMDDVRALFDAIINDDPLPGENDHNATSVPTTAAANPTTPSTSLPGAPAPPAVKPLSEQVHAVTTSPADVTVRVSNATEQSGLAGATSEGLQQWGFNVDNADDYPGTVKATKVLYSPGNEQAAATVSSALSGAPIERVSGLGSIVRVVLGSDFRTVTKPVAAGSQVSVQLNRGASVEPTELPDDLTVTNAADTTCE
ncbi:LCP family protein [Mycolicibacter heraklionensis]|uniref:LCP family protein n=1 Tax=Mycolicibacter heraklionensis TaxID=512402 RepID=UPI0007E9813A|nr:LCP family protein [Mycolicibacter heraklionensis]OBG33388.1 transcriptional regulator [Mycolicibacter heraklionensis]